jgi:hypothetical protein
MDYNDLNRVLKYGVDDATNLLRQIEGNPEHQQPNAVHRLVTADALQEQGRDSEANLLRSEHPIYFRNGKVYHHHAGPADMKAFGNAYAEAALWSSTDPDSGRPLEEEFTPHHFDKQTSQEMKADALHFYNSHYHLLKHADPVRAGIHFWLSRNGHGDGFRYNEDDYGVGYAKELHNQAKLAGEYELYPYQEGSAAPDDASSVIWHVGGSGGNAEWGQKEGLNQG